MITFSGVLLKPSWLPIITARKLHRTRPSLHRCNLSVIARAGASRKVVGNATDGKRIVEIPPNINCQKVKFLPSPLLTPLGFHLSLSNQVSIILLFGQPSVIYQELSNDLSAS